MKGEDTQLSIDSEKSVHISPHKFFITFLKISYCKPAVSIHVSSKQQGIIVLVLNIA